MLSIEKLLQLFKYHDHAIHDSNIEVKQTMLKTTNHSLLNNI